MRYVHAGKLDDRATKERSTSSEDKVDNDDEVAPSPKGKKGKNIREHGKERRKGVKISDGKDDAQINFASAKIGPLKY